MSASGEVSTRWRAQSLASRIGSSLLLAPIALAAVWFGGWALTAVVLLALLIAVHEFLRLAGRGHPVLRAWGIVAAAALILVAAPASPIGAGPVAFVLALGLVALSLRPPLEGRLAGAALTVFGVLYVAGLGVHLLLLRDLPHGRFLLLLVLAGTWAADVGAFFIGVLFGRVRIAPHISPGKSLEGLLGGIAATVAVVLLAAEFLPGRPVGRTDALLLGGVVALLAPLGDLFESLVKRNLRAKDASHLIPGHGGLLDRVDSLLLTAPAAYYLCRILLA